MKARQMNSRRSLTARSLAIFATLLILWSAGAKTDDLAVALQAFDNAQYDDALRQLQVLAKAQPKNPTVLYNLGRSQYHAGDFAAAHVTLETLLKDQPEHIEGHYLMGSTNIARVSEASLFRKARTAKDALTSWLTVVELNPKHVEGLYAVISFYITAPGFVGGDLDKAKAELPRLEALSPDWAMLARASLLNKEEQVEQAQALYQTASQRIQERAFPLFALANFQLTQQHYAAALTTLAEYEQRHHAWNDPNTKVTSALREKIESAMGPK